MKLVHTVFLFFLLFLTFHLVHAQEVHVVPRPNSISFNEGSYEISKNVTINASNELKNEALHLAEVLKSGFGVAAKIRKNRGDIELKIDVSLFDELGEEGYNMNIDDDGILIEAADAAGIFYAIQTFRQLLPPEFEFGESKNPVILPKLKIVDRPRFSWRAFMLDESRHFKGMATVKKLLDQMALVKMNIFHWHLTDDQGWRIEIKKYPKLTEIGSKRNDTQTARKSDLRTGEPHGGYYTQKEIREIIDYAKKRHITIVPEIEMPGHAMAAVASYNWLGTLGTTKEVSETFGKMDDSFDVTNPKVVRFLKDVLDEVMNLFPGSVIHIGGDEVNFEPWLKNKSMVSFMKDKDLQSPMDLQISFTNDISNYIDEAGKRMMGWNEIMGHNVHEDRGHTAVNASEKLALSAIVHFWKGDLELVNRSVEDGYDVVNSNHWDTYLDYTYKRLPLEKSYAFDPVPEGLGEQYHSKIKGLGAQMWSEWVPTVQGMEKQIFPRLAAYSEVGWTDLNQKNFADFQKALAELKTIWKLEGIEFYQK